MSTRFGSLAKGVVSRASNTASKLTVSVVVAVVASLCTGAVLGAIERQKFIPDEVAANPAFDAMYRAIPLTVMVSVLIASGAHLIFADSVRQGNAVWKHTGLIAGLFLSITLVLGVTSYVSNKLPDFLEQQKERITQEKCDDQNKSEVASERKAGYDEGFAAGKAEGGN